MKIFFCLSLLFFLSGCIEDRIDNVLYEGNLASADYWSDEPKILSAGVGFSDINFVDFEDVTKENAMAAGAAWLDDMTCDQNETELFTSLVLSSAEVTFKGKIDPSLFKDGAIGLDGQPVVFSWPILSNTLNPEDFRITLNTGEVLTPQLAGLPPNWEYNERNCVVLFSEVSNRLPSSDPNARFPIKCEIVDDATPLMLIGPNQEMVSAVGLSWETTTSPYDENQGPRLVGAKLNFCGTSAKGEGVGGSVLEGDNHPNDEFSLYGGGDFRLRMLTTGGFSPDGVRGVQPTDFEKFFRIHAEGEDGETVLIDKVGQDFEVMGGKLKVVGLSDLGQAKGIYDECYTEDRDNYIDIILVGDEAAARNITFLEIPSLAGGYSAFYNPGGPGTTPTAGANYSAAGPPDLEPVIIALDNPMRVSYDAFRYK
ncbi:MAG: phospholipase [Saprospiraceae bacterium]